MELSNDDQAWGSDSEWIKDNWINIFNDKRRPTADRPVLFILYKNLAREKNM